MSASSPILDQPQSIDYGLLPAGPIHALGNQEILCQLDRDCDVYDLRWPWADASYARRIRLRIVDIVDGELQPLVVRFFPGHQELIAGTEGVIVTKRLAVLHKSPDDRALLWLLECQSEGDHVIRLEIEIDWGEPLTQRIVDGLLVAQQNPEPARGIYAQSNAQSTRVFGDPHGRPDHIALDDPQRAQLVYHVLVNGIVEVPLMLTLSDVGEQVAWSHFLSLRDVEHIFQASSDAWGRLVRAGRVWTPDPQLNRAVETGKLAAIRHMQRLRTGFVPSDRRVERIPALVAAWDAIDPVQSRNLLAHLRRVAEETAGRLPEVLPVHPKEAPVLPASSALLHTNGAYLRALSDHLLHQGDAELLAAHLPAVQRCTEALVQLRWREPALLANSDAVQGVITLLRRAEELAAAAGDEVDVVRWESERRDLAQRFGAAEAVPPAAGFSGEGWAAACGWHPQEDRPWAFADAWQGMALAGDVVWRGMGVRTVDGNLAVEPGWLGDWPWWALLSLPLTEGRFLSLLWDGQTLHATQPVRSSLPVEVHKRLQIHGTDEFDFDPYFEMMGDPGDTLHKFRFRPVFQGSPP